MTIKRFGGDTSPEVGRGRFDEGSALTPFLGLDLLFGLGPLPLLDTLLGWPARSGRGRRDVGWRLGLPIEPNRD